MSSVFYLIALPKRLLGPSSIAGQIIDSVTDAQIEKEQLSMPKRKIDLAPDGRLLRAACKAVVARDHSLRKLVFGVELFGNAFSLRVRDPHVSRS